MSGYRFGKEVGVQPVLRNPTDDRIRGRLQCEVRCSLWRFGQWGRFHLRRTAVLGSAGTLIAGTLIASAIAAPAATADGRHHSGSEARGVQIAAARAAHTGIDWKDCPADWALS